MGLLNFFSNKSPAEADEQVAWVFVALYYNSDTGFMIVPYGESVKFGIVAVEPVIKLNCDVSDEELGEGVLSSITVASQARAAAHEPVIEKNSGIKNFAKFSKIYRCIDLSKSPDGYKIQEHFRDPKWGSYGGLPDDKDAVRLPLDAAVKEIGEAIKNCLAVQHEEPEDVLPEFQLTDGRTMRFKMPPDDYINIGNANTDAHFVFEYTEKSDVYFGFFYGTDYCPLDSATVKKIWEQYYGDLKTFNFSQIATGLFSYVARAKGKDKIICSLFFTDKGIWNEFLLHIETSGLTEKEIENILSDYETVAKSCVILKKDEDFLEVIQND
jgi:hypothetical protein